jgi:hypothetical protein
VNIEIRIVVFIIFFDDGFHCKACWVEVENDIGVEVREDDMTITLTNSKRSSSIFMDMGQGIVFLWQDVSM